MTEEIAAAAAPQPAQAPPKKKKKAKDPAKVKAGRKSRRKGNKRENELAKQLSLWWTAGKDNKALRRAPLSGGWLRKGSEGDILPVAESTQDFPFLIDVKDQKCVDEIEFADLLLRPDCAIFKWFDELTAMKQKYPVQHGAKQRMLIVHKYRQGDYCVLGQPELSYIEDNAGSIPHMKVKHHHRYEMLYVVPLQFLMDKDPETLKKFKVPNA
jgi:hypothetical protein